MKTRTYLQNTPFPIQWTEHRQNYTYLHYLCKIYFVLHFWNKHKHTHTIRWAQETPLTHSIFICQQDKTIENTSNYKSFMHCLAIMISKYYINLFILLMDFILFGKLLYFFFVYALSKTTQTIILPFLLIICTYTQIHPHIDTWKSYYVCRCFGCNTKSLKWFRISMWSLPPISSFLIVCQTYTRIAVVWKFTVNIFYFIFVTRVNVWNWIILWWAKIDRKWKSNLTNY